MKCSEAQQLVKLYIEKQLSDREMEQFLEHVEHCPECYEELEIYFSIYETLGVSDRNPDANGYDFRGKLIQDIKNTRRYLYWRKAYRPFRFAIVLVAELLLLLTVLTCFELHSEKGSKGTTVYLIIYGYQEDTESETQRENRDETESETQRKNGSITEHRTKTGATEHE